MATGIISDLGEIATQAASRQAFRSAAFERILRETRFDAACANSSTDGVRIDLDSCQIDDALLRQNQVEYMEEFSPVELGVAAAAKIECSDVVLSRRRMESLRLFTEFLFPRNIQRYAIRLWANRRGSFWYVFMREGGARWKASELTSLELAMSVVAIGEALHTPQAANPVSGETKRLFMQDHRLTPAEIRVAELAERGLTNGEIAKILGNSATTVRNQLASACSKLRVSRRAELTYALANAETGETFRAAKGRIYGVLQTAARARGRASGRATSR